MARDGRAMVVRRTLVPVIGVDDVILPAFDDTLGSLAIRAQQGDTDARDALFFAYLPKLDRLMSNVRPPFAWAGTTGTWDRDDIEQEAYLVFIEILDGWSGDVSFTAWLLSRFPWRLRSAIRAGVARPVAPRRHLVSLDVVDESLATWIEYSDPDERRVVDVLVDALPPDLAQVLVQRALLGRPLTDIARDMQLSRRTLVRYWHQVRQRAIEVLGDLSGDVQE